MLKKQWITAEEVYEKKLRNKKLFISFYIAFTIFFIASLTVWISQ